MRYFLRFVSKKIELELTFNKEAGIFDAIICHTHSDFPRSKLNKNSIRIYFFFAGIAISQLFKLWSIFALSTFKKKYIAICEEKKKIALLDYLIAKMEFGKTLP